MSLPTTLVIGPMKAGTTRGHDHLAWHEDICLPQDLKETFFFDWNFDRGTDWDGSHFSHYDHDCHRAVIEVALRACEF